MSGYRETLLKGGSLNRTALREYDDGRRVVRKSIARAEAREYGFVRWYSQFKRLQRYGTLFRGLFPAILDASTEGAEAWFEIEYVAGSRDLKQHLSGDLPDAEIEAVLDALLAAADRMHDAYSFPSYAGSLALYHAEEVGQRLRDAFAHPDFRAFAEQEEIVVDGRAVPTLLENLDWLAHAFAGLEPVRECFTHGNMTLENILYVADERRIVFVDPYEENVVDCREAEYSQVLQCSKQHYGYINDRAVAVDGAHVRFAEPIPATLRAFNARFEAALAGRLTPAQWRTTRFLEASQFTRMLPFKLATGDGDKAKYFYGVASRCVADLRADKL